MRKIAQVIIPLVVVILTIFVIRYSININECSLENTPVCFNIKAESFEFEPNASVLIRVPNQEAKTQLEELWKQEYPQAPNVLQIDVGKAVSADQVSSVGEDIFLLEATHAALSIASLYPLNSEIMPLVAKQVDIGLAEDLNRNNPVFIPAFISGDLFIIDQTSLTNNNLSENSLISFEKIIQSQAMLSQSYEVIFPLVLDDFDTLYPLLTIDNWYPFSNYELSDANFDSEHFLNGLKFIETLGNTIWDTKNPTNDPNHFVWQFDTVLVEQTSPISLSKPYVDLEFIQSITQSDYLFTAYPRYNDIQPNHIASVEGWVMHESTRYPSAAHEVLTFLRSPSATQIITNTTDKIPAINSQQLRTIDIPLDKSQQALCHNQARTKPLVAIPNHSDKLLWDVFDDIDIVETIKEVYAHRMTPEEAQDEIVENYQEWIEQYQ